MGSGFELNSHFPHLSLIAHHLPSSTWVNPSINLSQYSDCPCNLFYDMVLVDMIIILSFMMSIFQGAAWYPPLVCMLSQRLDDLLVKACLILHWRNSLLLSEAVWFWSLRFVSPFDSVAHIFCHILFHFLVIYLARVGSLGMTTIETVFFSPSTTCIYDLHFHLGHITTCPAASSQAS